MFSVDRKDFHDDSKHGLPRVTDTYAIKTYDTYDTYS